MVMNRMGRVACAASAAFLAAACARSADTPADTTTTATAAPPADTLTTASGLRYVILQRGTGPQPTVGQTVAVHYRGTLLDGSLFDTSRGGQPYSFILGSGRVIRGWDEAVALMHVGDRAVFIIPAALAYGKDGSPPVIPPDSPLVFDMELVSAR